MRLNKKNYGGLLMWSLPARKTCPGSTKICATHCRATRAEQTSPTVLSNRQRNFIDSKKENFADDMIFLINKTVKRWEKFNNFFRIHEAGDFYSQDYLDDWKKIASAFPNIKFLAFTKSFHLNFRNIPANLQIVMSIMPDTKNMPLKGFPKAYTGDCKKMGEAIECPGCCDECGLCWNLSQIKCNVHFKLIC